MKHNALTPPQKEMLAKLAEMIQGADNVAVMIVTKKPEKSSIAGRTLTLAAPEASLFIALGQMLDYYMPQKGITNDCQCPKCRAARGEITTH